MSNKRKSATAPNAAEVFERVLEENRGAFGVLEDEQPLAPAEDAQRVCPTDEAAAARVRAALAQRPGLLDDVRRRGAVVALVVDDVWSDFVTTQWDEALYDVLIPVNLRQLRPVLVEVEADGGHSVVRAAERNLAEGLRAGRGALVVVADLTSLPHGVRLAIDVVVEVPALDEDGLTAVARKVGRGSSCPTFAASLPGRIEPSHLALAVRPGDTATDFVERLTRIVDADKACSFESR